MRSAAAFSIAWCFWSGSSFACAPPFESARYDIEHEGFGNIGSQVIVLSCDGENLIAETQISIAVNFLFFELYKREHRVREVWSGEHLVSFESDLIEGSDRMHVSASIENGSMVIDNGRAEMKAPENVISSNPWPPHFVYRDQLFSIRTGEMLSVQIGSAGEDVVKVRGQTRTARKYIVSGDLEAELWYDDAGWLRARLPNDRDDSMITLTRR